MSKIKKAINAELGKKNYDNVLNLVTVASYILYQCNIEYIDKDLIRRSWESTGQTTSTLIKKGDTGYNFTDIIGFAPNNSFSQDFDYKTFQKDNEGMLFTDVLEGINFKDATGIDPATVIPNGLLPREIGEYRSYYQLPFIYWNKLFKIFKEKGEEITGYDFVLDSSFFNENNPDWHRLVYMLKPLSSNKGNSG